MPSGNSRLPLLARNSYIVIVLPCVPLKSPIEAKQRNPVVQRQGQVASSFLMPRLTWNNSSHQNRGINDRPHPGSLSNESLTGDSPAIGNLWL